jgi:hypothetical protein
MAKIAFARNLFRGGSEKGPEAYPFFTQCATASVTSLPNFLHDKLLGTLQLGSENF